MNNVNANALPNGEIFPSSNSADINPDISGSAASTAKSKRSRGKRCALLPPGPWTLEETKRFRRREANRASAQRVRARRKRQQALARDGERHVKPPLAKDCDTYQNTKNPARASLCNAVPSMPADATAKSPRKSQDGLLSNMALPARPSTVATRFAETSRLHSQVSSKNSSPPALLPDNLSITQSTALHELFTLNASGLHMLHVAAALGDGFEELSLLSQDLPREHGIDVTMSGGITPLMVALLNTASATKTVQHLLALGADPKKTNASGQTALHIAARIYDDPTVLVPLIEAGLSPFEQMDRNARSPLQHAVKFGRTNNVLFMLSLASPGDGHATSALLASRAINDDQLCRALCEKFPYLDPGVG